MDVWKGVYPELKGIKGVMGVMGERGIPSTPLSRSAHSIFISSSASSSYSTPSALSSHASNSLIPSPLTNFTPSAPLSLSDIEKLQFYPLNPSLPPIIQLKLRCKEINFLLSKLQKSLEDKMTAEHTLSAADRFKKSQTHQNKDKDWYEKTLADQGFARLENGKIIKNEQEQNR